MQNKGLVKLFAVLFGLVSIYQLSFTFKANQIERNANPKILFMALTIKIYHIIKDKTLILVH